MSLRVSRVVFVLGLQGVGKSRYIDAHYPHSHRVDFEQWWLESEKDGLPMDDYERATYVKGRALVKLLQHLRFLTGCVVVEATGMSKVNQAFLRVMADVSWAEGATVEMIYLKPADYARYLESIKDNDGALRMYRDFSHGGPRWREPSDCPYLDVKTVLVDHSTWTLQEESPEEEPEVYEVRYG
jgi:hypothetical protein